MRGRKGEPAEIHLAKGNPGKRARKPVKIPDAMQIGSISPPAWLKKSRAGVEAWNSVAPYLASLNTLQPQDSTALARYCSYVANWITANDAIRKEGMHLDVIATNGAEVKKLHPAFKAREILERDLQALEAEFALNPRRRFEMLRNMAALGNLPPGDLFGAARPSVETPASEAPAAPLDDSLIGAAARLDSEPPPSRH